MPTAYSARTKNVILTLGGLAAGFMNGLLGAGGGILLVFIMNALLVSKAPSRTEGAVDSRDILANALASMLPVTVVSVINYAARGALPKGELSLFLFPAILGGLGGAWLLNRINADMARRIFAVIVILSGIIMIVRA